LARESIDVESFLRVGCTLLMQSAPARADAPRFGSVLRGWRNGAHLLIDRPQTQSGAPAALQEGKHYVVRFVHEGLACAVESTLLDWDPRSAHSTCRLSWPNTISFTSFRQHERVTLAEACQVTWADGRRGAGQLRDLSLGGCGFVTSDPIAEGEQVSLCIELPDGSRLSKAHFMVRNIREARDGALVGCSLVPGQARVEGAIAIFLSNALHRGLSAESNRAGSILVLEPDGEQADRIHRAFKIRDLQVILEENVVDGIFRLKRNLPVGLAVSVGLSDLPVDTFCELIRGYESFRNLSIVLYGASAEEGEALALRLGVDGHVAAGVSMFPNLALEMSKVISAKVVR